MLHVYHDLFTKSASIVTFSFYQYVNCPTLAKHKNYPAFPLRLFNVIELKMRIKTGGWECTYCCRKSCSPLLSKARLNKALQATTFITSKLHFVISQQNCTGKKRDLKSIAVENILKPILFALCGWHWVEDEVWEENQAERGDWQANWKRRRRRDGQEKVDCRRSV